MDIASFESLKKKPLCSICLKILHNLTNIIVQKFWKINWRKGKSWSPSLRISHSLSCHLNNKYEGKPLFCFKPIKCKRSTEIWHIWKLFPTILVVFWQNVSQIQQRIFPIYIYLHIVYRIVRCSLKFKSYEREHPALTVLPRALSITFLVVAFPVPPVIVTVFPIPIAWSVTFSSIFLHDNEPQKFSLFSNSRLKAALYWYVDGSQKSVNDREAATEIPRAARMLFCKSDCRHVRAHAYVTIQLCFICCTRLFAVDVRNIPPESQIFQGPTQSGTELCTLILAHSLCQPLPEFQLKVRVPQYLVL